MEGFYVDHHESTEKPLIVAREKIVLDANLVARQRGVRLGMEIRQAKAVVTDCVVKLWEPERYHARRNQWLDVCTDYTGVIEPLDQHIAALDLSGHPNPLDVTERVVRELVGKTKLNVHYGAAPSVWIAKLAADRQDLGRAVHAPTEFLADLPVSDLLPVSEDARNRLTFLGYRTIGEIAQLPLDTLQGQFGEEAHLILSASKGRHYQTVHAIYPLDSIQECLLFDGVIEDTETIDNGLQAIAERVGRRLTDKVMQGSKLAIRIEFEERSYSKDRRFTKPIHNPLTALIAMRLLIQDALDTPVIGIHVSLTDLEKTRYRQQELEGFNLRSKRPEALSAIGYVRTVFGDQSLKLGSEIELPRRVRVLKEWQNATGWR